MIDYKFNKWVVSGEPVENVWTKENVELIRGGTFRPILTDADLCLILYLFYVKELSPKEIIRHVGGVKNSSTIKCIVEGRYKSSKDVFNQFMKLKETNPEQLDKLFGQQ
ncbi:hypothetical protein CN327_25495 [Bacillus cereus]|nr:hypothetical protein CN327_25495 [Bacillus cereus]